MCPAKPVLQSVQSSHMLSDMTMVPGQYGLNHLALCTSHGSVFLPKKLEITSTYLMVIVMNK